MNTPLVCAPTAPPAGVPASLTAPELVVEPGATARTFVGPALTNPILLAAPERAPFVAPKVVTLPPAPAPSALDSSRARLQRLAQAAAKPVVERPVDLDNLLRRFDAVAAGGRR